MASEDPSPWSDKVKVLEFTSTTEFDSFVQDLSLTFNNLYVNHHFDSLSSLVELHKRFRSSSSLSLQEAWNEFTLDECAKMKELSCVGLSLTLKEMISQERPEWHQFISLGITNEWTLKETAPDAFWTDPNPPSFPEQCREHCLLFVKVCLKDGRQAVVFLDPARCFGFPLVVTEDGQPPQSPTLKLRRNNRGKDFTVSWGSSHYMRWTMTTWKANVCSETHLRVYVGKSFQAGSYMEWHNLLYPSRFYIITTPHKVAFKGVRVEIGKTPEQGIVFMSADEQDNENEVEAQELTIEEKQAVSMKAMAVRMGHSEVLKLIDELKVILQDEEFATQLLAIWKDLEEKIERTFSVFISQAQSGE